MAFSPRLPPLDMMLLFFIDATTPPYAAAFRDMLRCRRRYDICRCFIDAPCVGVIIIADVYAYAMLYADAAFSA